MYTILYRGSDFDDVEVGKYFSTSYDFSKDYGTVRKYKVDLGDVFDIINPLHFTYLKNIVGEISDPYADEDNYPELQDIQDPKVIEDTGNSWEVTEEYISSIVRMGYDSARILEDGIVNYIVFKPQDRVSLAEGRIKRIEMLLEHYLATSTWYGNGIPKKKNEVDVYKNSDSTEIRKLLKESERGNLRFAMNSREDYILFDADKMVHIVAVRYAKLQNEFDEDENLLGIIFSSENSSGYNKAYFKNVNFPCAYIYYGSANRYYGINSNMLSRWGSGTEENMKHVKDQFQETRMYRNLKRAGISEITVGAWL
jgi:hypothetical protein